MSTDPFESYKLYNALKLHFEQAGYDAIRYNYKSNVTPKSFFNRKDKYFFAKLAKKYNENLKEFYISQFINTEKYVGDMMDEEADQNYRDYKRIQESIHRVFSVDIMLLFLILYLGSFLVSHLKYQIPLYGLIQRNLSRNTNLS